MTLNENMLKLLTRLFGNVVKTVSHCITVRVVGFNISHMAAAVDHRVVSLDAIDCSTNNLDRHGTNLFAEMQRLRCRLGDGRRRHSQRHWCSHTHNLVMALKYNTRRFTK